MRFSGFGFQDVVFRISFQDVVFRMWFSGCGFQDAVFRMWFSGCGFQDMVFRSFFRRNLFSANKGLERGNCIYQYIHFFFGII